MQVSNIYNANYNKVNLRMNGKTCDLEVIIPSTFMTYSLNKHFLHAAGVQDHFTRP